MSLRSDYVAAKRRYHQTGKAAMATHRNSEAHKLYEAAKRSYHTLGRKLAKKGK